MYAHLTTGPSSLARSLEGVLCAEPLDASLSSSAAAPGAAAAAAASLALMLLNEPGPLPRKKALEPSSCAPSSSESRRAWCRGVLVVAEAAGEEAPPLGLLPWS